MWNLGRCLARQIRVLGCWAQQWKGRIVVNPDTWQHGSSLDGICTNMLSKATAG